MEKHIGEVLNDRYMITEIVGVGGMAYVYKAFDKVCNRVVAVKILKDEFMSDAQFRRRFTNESKAITMLSHENIVDVYDVSLEGDSLYIVMEYIDGITLKEYMTSKGILSDSEALHFVKQILSGLAHAHERGIVHRDIKPHNIILLKDGTIKITDFGIARLTKFDTQTISDQAIGSVHYISPEQASGDRTDERSDIYSVGIILYEALTGRLPFDADTAVAVALMQVQSQPDLPSELNADLKQGLEDITLKAIMKDPSVRYQSAGAMLADISQYEADPSVVFNYTSGEEEAPAAYVDDNSPTLFVPDMTPNAVTEPEIAEDDEQVEDEPEEAGPIPFKKRFLNTGLPIIGGVLSALVILAVVAICLAFQLELFGAKPISCPDVLNMTLEEAEEKYDFEFDVTEEANNEHKKGVIFAQFPEPGEEIKKGDTIYVTVSSGWDGTIPDSTNQNDTNSGDNSIPDIFGMTKAKAKNKLESFGYSSSDYEFEQIDDNEVPAGCVVKVDIRRSNGKHYYDASSGDEVFDGDVLIIYLSNGPEEVKVPNLIGKTESEAKKALRELGLEVGTITKEPNDAPKGEVFDQSIKKGTTVDAGASIDISVSTGSTDSSAPAKKVLPALVGLTKAEAQAALTKNGFSASDFSFETVADSMVEKGLVIKATVSGKTVSSGYELSDGEKIVIQISAGSDTATPPDNGSEGENNGGNTEDPGTD
ncbi:MAG: Stk1 family PASTA domain-containing Ser/Thr kinase, partial [Clostridia bacterium]|nr:Stk1 family PASTA domain-containing Ser/Thr kinase [Clostridia bacterium]